MQKVKLFIKRVESQMGRKAFNMTTRNKARFQQLLQAEYIQMLEESLAEPAPAPESE